MSDMWLASQCMYIQIVVCVMSRASRLLKHGSGSMASCRYMPSSSSQLTQSIGAKTACLQLEDSLSSARRQLVFSSNTRCFRVSKTERYCLIRICFEVTCARSRRHAVLVDEDPNNGLPLASSSSCTYYERTMNYEP
jgi:hypothetical protein